MVRRALLPAGTGIVAAALAGAAVGGPDASWSAAVGVGIVAANFAAHGLSLAWASTISVGAVMAVALGGVLVRMGVIVGSMFALDAFDPFSPLAFGLAVVPATLLLLAFEARLVSRGLGATLDIPADPAALAAASVEETR